MLNGCACIVSDAFINFEKRHGLIGRVRQIFERYTKVHPTIQTWLKVKHEK